MDSITEQRDVRTHASRRVSFVPAAAGAEASPAAGTLEERRGAAMRRLFPKRVGGAAGRRVRHVALQMYAYLAEAPSVDEFERRLRRQMQYPTELIEQVELRDGRSVLLRPVLPSDAPMHRAFVQSMSPTTRRYRFHGVVADLPESVLRYMTEVDYVDHLALVAEAAEPAGARQVAEARWARRQDDPRCADFAIAIADDYQRGGLGNALLDRLERSARAKGIDRLCGHVLRANRRMRDWLEARGWRIAHDPEDLSVVCAERRLVPEQTSAWREAA